jgi:hypothetical protein
VRSLQSPGDGASRFAGRPTRGCAVTTKQQTSRPFARKFVWDRNVLASSRRLTPYFVAAAPPPPECSGHGTQDQWTSRCTCDTPFPVPGQRGWTGDICQAEAIGIATQTVQSHAVQTALLDAFAW